MNINNSTNELTPTQRLDNFLIGAWDACPDTGYRLNLRFSRICPLAREVYAMRGESDNKPPAFGCSAHNTSDCGAQSWVLDTVLQEEEDGSRPRRLGERYRELLDSWYALAPTAKYINAMVDEVVAAVEKRRRNAKYQPRTGNWADYQCVLWEMMLSDPDRR